jgi:TonB-linked SusC/RagA family outer membrane protein
MLIMIAQLSFAQGLTVKGNVKDSQGAPLPGVSVQIQGTSQGTLTDVDGNYSISAPSSKSTLVFSFIGMETQKIVVGNQHAISLTLKDSSIALDEVVSIGYARIKKSDVTGAMSQISEKTLKERPVQNAINAMQGKAAGVDIVSNVRPGEIASVQIRGTRSVKGSNSPLYVVDGIILMGDMNDINPNDIASMEILKDASSTAIYGSRGANGVILITTKNGKKGKVNIDYNGAVTFDRINSVTDWASGGEMLDRYRSANINGGTYTNGSTTYNYPNPAADITKFGNNDAATIAAIRGAYEWNDPGTYSSVKTRAATTEEKAAGWPDQVPVYNSSNVAGTNWRKLLTRTGITQNHQIALSSGSENSKLYISLGYFKNEGTQKNQNYTRYSSRINGEVSPQKWLTIGSSLNATYSEQQYGTIVRSGSATGANDAYGMALSQYVMAKPYDDAGNLIIYPGNNSGSPTWNPLIDLSNTTDLTKVGNIQANIFSDIRFTPWLRYHLNFGSSYRTKASGAWQGSAATTRRSGATATSAAASLYNYEYYQYLVENVLYANKTFGVHDLGFTLMQSGQYSRTVTSYMTASKIIADASLWYNMSANANGTPDSYGSGYSVTSMLSYMARFNYSLMGKYILSASIRTDGASQLAQGHKWDSFPAASIAWKIQEESWMKKFKWIDELKLRFGMGTSGNASVSAYSSAGPLAQYAYVYGTTAAYGMLPYNMPNPELGWEHTTQYNLGLDFDVLNHRLSGTIEAYYSDTKRLLLDRSIPALTGYINIVDNVGELHNKGLEITLSSKNIVNKNFTWSTDFSFSTNKNAIVSLVNGKVDMPSQGLNGWYIGQPLNVFRTYKLDGIWQNTDADKAEIAKWKANGTTFYVGQYKPVDQNGDYKLTDADKVIQGGTDPKYVLGLTNTFAYKNWELSFFLYSRIGQKYFASLIPGGSNPTTGFVGYGRHVDDSQFWSPSNPTGKYPQPTTATLLAAVTQASYVNDGSFCIVRNISLGYKVPAKILNKINVRSCQIYAQVMNPFIFGGEVVKSGINPDDTNSWTSTNSVGEASGGTNNNTMMITSFVAGIRVGF